jgi:hypothetical protein
MVFICASSNLAFAFQKLNWAPDQDMKGQNYVLENVELSKLNLDDLKGSFELKMLVIPTDQSDWGRLRILSDKMPTKIRVFGFHHLGNKTVIDETTTDIEFIAMFHSGINKDAVLRSPESDV